MVSAPSRMSNECTELQMSTICAFGLMLRMTPFIVPTKWSVTPKSVVMVIRRLATGPSCAFGWVRRALGKYRGRAGKVKETAVLATPAWQRGAEPLGCCAMSMRKLLLVALVLSFSALAAAQGF